MNILVWRSGFGILPLGGASSVARGGVAQVITVAAAMCRVPGPFQHTIGAISTWKQGTVD